MLPLPIPDEEQGAFPGGGSSTADISPSNLRKALPVGYEEREREMDCSAVCSVLTDSTLPPRRAGFTSRTTCTPARERDLAMHYSSNRNKF